MIILDRSIAFLCQIIDPSSHRATTPANHMKKNGQSICHDMSEETLIGYQVFPDIAQHRCALLRPCVIRAANPDCDWQRAAIPRPRD